MLISLCFFTFASLQADLKVLCYVVSLLFYTQDSLVEGQSLVLWSMFASLGWYLKCPVFLFFFTTLLPLVWYRVISKHFFSFSYNRAVWYKAILKRLISQVFSASPLWAVCKPRATWSLIAAICWSLAGFWQGMKLLAYMDFLSSDGW